MADEFLIYEYCQQCQGTGEITINDEAHDPGPPQNVSCTKCNGTGKILRGEAVEKEEG